MTRISSANPHRPDPVLTIDTAFFWAAADEGRFVAQQCGGCATLWHRGRSVPNACRRKNTPMTCRGAAR
jgi:hypothetical protein